MSTLPNPWNCQYGNVYPSVPSLYFPTPSYGDTGGHWLYLATIVACHQGYYVPSQTKNTGFYGHTMIHHVTQFQLWWQGWGAPIGPADGRAGPVTMSFYRMMVGHVPW